jgi:choline dehydrogenase-like flavoprotein
MRSFALSPDYRAIKTPQILELSGIGKREVLEKVGIDVKLDLPVGENVQGILTWRVWSFR